MPVTSVLGRQFRCLPGGSATSPKIQIYNPHNP